MKRRGPLYRQPPSPESPHTPGDPGAPHAANMGADHSTGPREYTDPELAWEEHGFRLKSTVPVVPGKSVTHMLDEIKLEVVVECKKPVPLRELTAYCWTDCYHVGFSDGLYHTIPLKYVEGSRDWDDWGITTYTFSASILTTNNNEARLTFYAKLGNITVWANQTEVDHVLDIRPPSEGSPYGVNVSHSRITEKFYLGNFAAALKAEELGYDVIMRFCDRVPKKPASQEGAVQQLFTAFNRDSAASSEISPEKLLEMIEWLELSKETYKKLLLADRYGIGRVGSAIVTYVFANNPHLTFQEVFDLVSKKHTIYTHTRLGETLDLLLPRE